MDTLIDAPRVLLPDRPLTDLAGYLAMGGGEGLLRALRVSPDTLIDEVLRSGLRGRGGAGFPTGRKWQTVTRDPCPTRYVVCNAAEGEPGTFKDRWLLRTIPYLVIEGLAIAAQAVSARGAFLALKASFRPEVEAVSRALDEMRDADLLGPVSVEIATGPDDYLFGEEKGLLEVIEGRPALPRVLRPYQVGLFASRGAPNPTAVNNAETLANVPLIIRDGADRFREHGTDASPGTMLFTVCGDVRRQGVYELPLGLPLRALIDDVAGGVADGRQVKAVFPGASHGVLPADLLDTPLTFDDLREVGSGLGSGGFIVYDDTACIVAATATFTRFLHNGSCGQCPACSQGALRITAALESIDRGSGTDAELDSIRDRCGSVTGGQRCALPDGTAAVTRSALERFADEFSAHLGVACPSPRRLESPELVDYDAAAGQFVPRGRAVYPLDDAAVAGRR